MFGATRIAPLDQLRFAWAIHHVQVGRFGLTRCRHGGSLAIDWANRGLYALALSQRGDGECAESDVAHALRPDVAAVMLSPDTDTTSRMVAGYHGVVVTIPRRVLEREAGAMLDGEEGRALRFTPGIDLAVGAGAELARLVGFLVGEAARTDGISHVPAIADDLTAAILHAMLLRLPHTLSDALQAKARPAAPRYLRRAEDFLAANAERMVTSAELAAEVGVSVRALQGAFRRYRGCSPTEFVRQRRLELARQRLLACDGATVTEIALACGFGHLGRFSVEYRARFAESPSQTRHRAGTLDRGGAPRDPDSAAARSG